MSDLSDELLEQRAEALARAAVEQREESLVQLLRLSAAGHEYALRASYVDGVVNWVDWTRVPGAPAVALGVLAWRGSIVAVLDLARALGHATGPCQHAVVLQKDGRRVALAVSQVEEFVALPLRLGPVPGGVVAGSRLLEGVLPDGAALLQAASFLDQEVVRAL